MGDQIGQAVEGTLYYAPLNEFERVRGSGIAISKKIEIYADMCRLNALYMIARAGSGHIGSSFSSLDIVSWLLLQEMNSGDVYFSSKGHDAPGYYSALIGMGRMSFDLVHKLRRIDGLPGHPDVGTEGMVTNTGSLGMGVSKAKGMVFANRRLNKAGRVFVMTGDGELQEGQFWESLASAVNHGLHEIVVIIDHNKLQSDTYVKNVSDLGDLEAKLKAFGWAVGRCDGHDVQALTDTLGELSKQTKKPKIIIADTIKGRGVSFMEHTSLDSDVAMYRFHSGAPDSISYRLAAQEIMDRLQARLQDVNAAPLLLESIERGAPAAVPAAAQRMVPAYSNALLEQAEKNPNLVALDADLILDTGLISFKEKYPNRFVECGIAEQDMVSQAGGMALNGLLPVVHSFACFLSPRPNEQIYNNATEKTKVIYVGSLAGVIPGGPGHSHQAVRDIAVLASVPGLTLVEPCCEQEVGAVVEYCVEKASGSSYIRLVSIPCDIPYMLPANYSLELGKGTVLREGADAVLIAYGPVMLSQAFMAAESLESSTGIRLKVVNLPWLNTVDSEWLKSIVSGVNHLFTLDNHYLSGGQGEIIASVVAQNAYTSNLKVTRFGLTEIPKCGTNDEVLKAHGLDAQSLAAVIAKTIRP